MLYCVCFFVFFLVNVYRMLNNDADFSSFFSGANPIVARHDSGILPVVEARCFRCAARFGGPDCSLSADNTCEGRGAPRADGSCSCDAGCGNFDICLDNLVLTC